MNTFKQFLCSISRFTLITAAVGIMLLVSVNSADAAYKAFVKILNVKSLGILTQGCLTLKNREEFCSSVSYSSSIGIPVEATLPKYGPVQIVFELNRVHPRLLDAMVKQEPLTVSVDFMSTNNLGAEILYHRVTLDNAKVIDVRRWTGSTLPSASDNSNLYTVTFDYASITEANIDGNTSFTGSK